MGFEYKIENNKVTITGVNDKSVKSLDIPEFIDNLLVININDLAFSHCKSLTEINIPNSITNIGAGAFRCCDSLTKINIPNSVTNIGNYTFSYCYSLKEINGFKLKGGVNIINNRFIYYNQKICKIKYLISDDFIRENNDIFINGEIIK